MCKVDLGVCDVEVAAEDDGFFCFEGFEVVEECGVPLLAVGKTGEAALGVWRVAVDEVVVGKFGGDDSAFAPVFFVGKVVRDGQRGAFGEDGRAGVSFFLRAVPEVVGVVGQGEADLVGVCFCFLEAHDVRFL